MILLNWFNYVFKIVTYGIKPSLVQVNDEDDIISETSYSEIFKGLCRNGNENVYDNSLYKIHLVRKRFVYYLCAVGIVMINANRSSMNVLNALYMKARQGRWATDWKMIIVEKLYRITDKYCILIESITILIWT